jgi:hypothetical protein
MKLLSVVVVVAAVPLLLPVVGLLHAPAGRPGSVVDEVPAVDDVHRRPASSLRRRAWSTYRQTCTTPPAATADIGVELSRHIRRRHVLARRLGHAWGFAWGCARCCAGPPGDAALQLQWACAPTGSRVPCFQWRAEMCSARMP